MLLVFLKYLNTWLVEWPVDTLVPQLFQKVSSRRDEGGGPLLVKVYMESSCQNESGDGGGSGVLFTARRYASAVLGVVILSVRLSHTCFVKKEPTAIFLYHMKG